MEASRYFKLFLGVGAYGDLIGIDRLLKCIALQTWVAQVVRQGQFSSFTIGAAWPISLLSHQEYTIAP